MLHAQDMRANPFGPVLKGIAVTRQLTVLQNNLVLAISAVNGDRERLVTNHLEAFGFSLVAVRLRDKTVKMRLQHTQSVGLPSASS